MNPPRWFWYVLAAVLVIAVLAIVGASASVNFGGVD